MKSQLVRRLSKMYFLPNLPGYIAKGHLLYHQDLEHILRGFWFESSAFDRDSFTVEVFVQPLYIPVSHLSFTFGHRLGSLGKGYDIWWKYGEETEALIMQEILSLMISAGIPFLEEQSSIEKLINQYSNLDLMGNKHVVETISYAYVLMADYSKARNLLDSFFDVLTYDIKQYPTVPWIIEIQKRVQVMREYLKKQDYEDARLQLNEWRDFTLSKIGLY